MILTTQRIWLPQGSFTYDINIYFFVLLTPPGSARRMVALLSTPYLQSKVCREEFSLALALNLDKTSELQLTSLLVEELGNLPVWCSEPLPVECVSAEGINEEQIKAVCEDLVQGLTGTLQEFNGGAFCCTCKDVVYQAYRSPNSFLDSKNIVEYLSNEMILNKTYYRCHSNCI